MAALEATALQMLSHYNLLAPQSFEGLVAQTLLVELLSL